LDSLTPYNVTEAALGPGLLFINFLMGSLTVPKRAKADAHAPSPLALGEMERAADVSFEMTGPSA